jgi:hypothetical protein
MSSLVMSFISLPNEEEKKKYYAEACSLALDKALATHTILLTLYPKAKPQEVGVSTNTNDATAFNHFLRRLLDLTNVQLKRLHQKRTQHNSLSRRSRRSSRIMPMLIRRLKKITPPPTKPSKSSPAAALTRSDLTPLVHHDIQLRKTEAAATGATDMNKKSSAPSDNTISPQKASASAADTSDDKSASINSDERNDHDDRKRKSSSVDEELAREKRARRGKLCPADGCTNLARGNGGVCKKTMQQ